MAKKKGNAKNKVTFKKVSAFCRKNAQPFTKEFGRCFKKNYPLCKTGKKMITKF